MADAVATQTIQDGSRSAVFKFTNVSDGTGESAVVKIDVSTLSADPVTGKACTSVEIEKIWYSTIGMGVQILFDATTLNKLNYCVLCCVIRSFLLIL